MECYAIMNSMRRCKARAICGTAQGAAALAGRCARPVGLLVRPRPRPQSTRPIRLDQPLLQPVLRVRQLRRAGGGRQRTGLQRRRLPVGRYSHRRRHLRSAASPRTRRRPICATSSASPSSPANARWSARPGDEGGGAGPDHRRSGRRTRPGRHTVALRGGAGRRRAQDHRDQVQAHRAPRFRPARPTWCSPTSRRT